MAAGNGQSRIAAAMLPLDAILTLAGLFVAPAVIALLFASAWIPDADALDLLWCALVGAGAAGLLRRAGGW